MARNGRKGRGCLITLLVLIILGLLIWFVGVPLANNKAEDVVDNVIQDVLSSPGMPDLGYRDIQINAQKGQVDVFDLVLPLEEGSSLHASHIKLTVSPSELITFGLGQSNGLTKADVDLQQLSYTTRDTEIALGKALIKLDGLINLNDVENSVIRDVQITADKVQYTDSKSKMAFNTETLAVDITGNMTMATLEKDIDGILNDIAYVDVEATHGKLVPDVAMMEQIGMFAMVSPWIADTNNWGYDSVSLEARSIADSVEIDAFALSAPLMDATGSAKLPRKEDGPLAVNVDIAELNSQVRAELAPIAMFMGQQIPEGAFNLNLDWTEGGMPSFTLR